jgi:hypothetical protein
LACIEQLLVQALGRGEHGFIARRESGGPDQAIQVIACERGQSVRLRQGLVGIAPVLLLEAGTASLEQFRSERDVAPGRAVRALLVGIGREGFFDALIVPEKAAKPRSRAFLFAPIIASRT